MMPSFVKYTSPSCSKAALQHTANPTLNRWDDVQRPGSFLFFYSKHNDEDFDWTVFDFFVHLENCNLASLRRFCCSGFLSLRSLPACIGAECVELGIMMSSYWFQLESLQGISCWSWGYFHIHTKTCLFLGHRSHLLPESYKDCAHMLLILGYHYLNSYYCLNIGPSGIWKFFPRVNQTSWGSTVLFLRSWLNSFGFLMILCKQTFV